MIRVLLLTLGFWSIGNLAYLMGYLVAGLAMGLRIGEFALYYGPSGFTFRVAGIPVRIGTLPLGGYVKFDDSDQQWTRLAPARRLVVLFGAPTAGLLYAMVCLGPVDGAKAVLDAFGQIIHGSWDHAYAIRMLSDYFVIVQRQHYIMAAGTVGAKLVAFNLLPFPILTGGLILLELIGGTAPRWVAALQVWTLPMLAFLAGSWFIALVRAVAI